MRIPSGVTDQYVYFVAVDATDLHTRETGLAAKMKVKRSRNGGAAAYYTTPTIAAVDTGQPGDYKLLIDEDTTIDAGNWAESYLLHIRDTGGHMARVSREIELFRPNDTGVENALARIQSDVDTGLRAQISDVDTGLHDTLADYDTGMRALLALRDTGAIARAVWAGDTGLRDHIDNTDTGLRARIDDLDTGVTQRLGVLQTGVSDTGLIANAAAVRVQTDKLTFDTGNELHADIRKVNNVQVQGVGANADKWRPE